MGTEWFLSNSRHKALTTAWLSLPISPMPFRPGRSARNTTREKNENTLSNNFKKWVKYLAIEGHTPSTTQFQSPSVSVPLCSWPSRTRTWPASFRRCPTWRRPPGWASRPRKGHSCASGRSTETSLSQPIQNFLKNVIAVVTFRRDSHTDLPRALWQGTLQRELPTVERLRFYASLIIDNPHISCLR